MMEEKAVKTVKICGQENLNKIKTLKESNIEIIKKNYRNKLLLKYKIMTQRKLMK